VHSFLGLFKPAKKPKRKSPFMLFKKTLSRYSLSKEESRKISGPISSKSSKPTSRPYNINKNPTSSSLNFSEGSGTMSCHQNASNGPKSTFYLIIKQN
jgi:hypothetical protein